MSLHSAITAPAGSEIGRNSDSDRLSQARKDPKDPAGLICSSKSPWSLAGIPIGTTAAGAVRRYAILGYLHPIYPISELLPRSNRSTASRVGSALMAPKRVAESAPQALAKRSIWYRAVEDRCRNG